jgi:hypothetical protein
VVPNLEWRVEHHFAELEGTDKVFLNPPVRGYFMESASQFVSFRLDRSGASLDSGADMRGVLAWPCPLALPSAPPLSAPATRPAWHEACPNA